MSFDVKGKTALVTGANRGIGRAITAALLDQGVGKVYAAVRDTRTVQPLIEEYGDRVVPLQLDLTRPEAIEAAAGKAGDVELVVNNAGVLKTATPFAEDALSSLKFEMDVNVFGLLRMARAFAPVLKANGGGALVQLNSVVSMKAFPDFATYCASKAAAYSITQSLQTLLRDQGTAVVSVHPGPIATDMGSAAGFDETAEPPELVGAAIVDALQNGRFHAFPDSMAQQVGAAYQEFAENVIEVEMSEV